MESTRFLPRGPRFNPMGQDFTGLGLAAQDSAESLLSPSNRMGLIESADTVGLLNDSRIGEITSKVNIKGLFSSRNRTGLLTSRSGFLECNATIGLKASSDNMGLLATHNRTSTSSMEGLLAPRDRMGTMASTDNGGQLAGNNGSGMNTSSDTLELLNDRRIRFGTSTVSREGLLAPSNRIGFMASRSTAGLLEPRNNGLGLLESFGAFDSRRKVSGTIASSSILHIKRQNRCSTDIHINNKGQPFKSS